MLRYLLRGVTNCESIISTISYAGIVPKNVTYCVCYLLRGNTVPLCTLLTQC